MKRFVIICTAALCGLALACSESELVSPDVESAESTSLAKGKPGPAPTGTIYMYLSGSVYETDTDGGNRRDTKVACCGAPSRDLHGGTRWFAVVKPSTGTYPDGRSRQDLFLEKDGGTESVQVTSETDDFDLEVQREAVNWRPEATTNRDAFVTFVGRRVSSERCLPDTTTGYYLEGGIYAVPVNFSASPSPAVGPVSLLVSSEPNGRCGEAMTPGHQEPRMGRGHDWSPDGSRLVVGYGDLAGRADLTIYDIANNDSLVITKGEDPSWSVRDEIVFTGWPDRGQVQTYRIGADGSDETLLIESRSGGAKSRYPDNASWSPDGEFIVYRVITCCIGISAETFRATRNGSGRTSLTRDLEWASPLGWR